MEKSISVKINNPTLSPLVAWRNVLCAVAVGWLIIALPDFGFLTQYLAQRMPQNRVLASLYLDLGFFVSTSIVILLVCWWQHAHGETLADLGWRRPTTKTAIIISILYGALWTSSFYFTRGHLDFLAFPWERFIMAPLGIVLATGEELLFRGFVMEQLRRAGIATWIQILVSAVTIASYHGLVGLHYYPLYFVSSIVLFGILAVIHVIGKRSLMPNTLAHAMTHFFGDPSSLVEMLIGAFHNL